MRTHDGCQFAQVTFNARVRTGPRVHYPNRERQQHVAQVRNGAPCYLIVCEAADTTARPRRVRRFNDDQLFPGGRVLDLDGDCWIEMRSGVAVQEVALSPAGGLAQLRAAPAILHNAVTANRAVS